MSVFSAIGAPEVLYATITMAVIGRGCVLCLRLRNAFEVLVVDDHIVAARDHIFCLVLVLVSFHFFFFLLFCFLPRKMSFYEAVFSKLVGILLQNYNLAVCFVRC